VKQTLPRSIVPFIAGAALLITATTIIPTVYVLYLGVTHESTSIGYLGNYRRILNDPLFLQSCLNSGLFSVWYATLQVILAFIVGKAVLRTGAFIRSLFLVMLVGPWVISEMASVIIWRWIFFAQVGPLDQLSAWIGFGRLSIMIHPNSARVALLIAALWRGFAFSTVFAIGVLASIPRILYHAANVEDLGWWRTFRTVELPEIKSAAIMMGIVLSIQTVSQFTLSARLTNGGPAHATTLISNYIYERLITEPHPGLSAAAGSIVFIAVSCFVILFSFLGRSRRS